MSTMFTSNGFISCSCLSFKFRNESQKTGLLPLSQPATPASGARRRSCFLAGFLAPGRAEVRMATPSQARLITLIAASGKRSMGDSRGSSGRKRSGGGGAAAAATAGIAPRPFGADRTSSPSLMTIDADELYTMFDPPGLNKRWTVNEILRVKQSIPTEARCTTCG